MKNTVILRWRQRRASPTVIPRHADSDSRIDGARWHTSTVANMNKTAMRKSSVSGCLNQVGGLYDDDRQRRIESESPDKVLHFLLPFLGCQRHHNRARNDLRLHPSHLSDFKWRSNRQFCHACILLGELHR